MGRIDPPAGGQSASAGAVAEAWREHDASRVRRSAQLVEDAAAWVAGQPGLLVAGEPCHVAIEAAMSIRQDQPQLGGRAFLAAVVAAREAHWRRLAAAGWFSDVEVDRVLAGEGWPS